MKKVLFITYYWPPAGGPGVQRFYYFAKKIRAFGWEPIIYTVKDGTYFALDYDLEKDLPSNIEVIKTKSIEPHDLYNLLSFKKKNKKINISFASEKKGLLHRLAVFIRGNFFIPDARMLWIKPSIKYLNKYLEKNRIDAIISTSPPQSMHLIAKEVSKQNNIPWIADFRDPWTRISYFKDLKLINYSKNKHLFLEQQVLQNADVVVSVTPSWVKDFKNLGAKRCVLITNGYDEEFCLPAISPNVNKFVITFMGSLPITRNPLSFWKAVKNKIEIDKLFESKIEIHLVGNVDENIFKYLNKYGLKNYIHKVGYINHSEVYDYYLRSDVLLLIGTQGMLGHIPGKTFEYVYAQKPIFSIGPAKSDVVKLLNETNLGLNVDFGNDSKTLDVLDTFWEHYKKGDLMNVYKSDTTIIKKYSRYETTKKLVQVLDSIIK